MYVHFRLCLLFLHLELFLNLRTLLCIVATEPVRVLVPVKSSSRKFCPDQEVKRPRDTIII